MTAATSALQKGVFASLAGDPALLALLGGARIFDGPPANTPFPYVTFGRTSVFDWSTGTEDGTEQLFSLHVWSRAKGRKEALEIMARIEARLEEGLGALDGWHLVNLRLEFSETRFDEDLSVQHGLLRFRAVLEGL